MGEDNLVKIEHLQWDDANIEHVTRHQADPGELEDVCFGMHIARRAEGGRRKEEGTSSAARLPGAGI